MSPTFVPVSCLYWHPGVGVHHSACPVVVSLLVLPIVVALVVLLLLLQGTRALANLRDPFSRRLDYKFFGYKH